MKREIQLWYKCIQLDFIIMIKSISNDGLWHCWHQDDRITQGTPATDRRHQGLSSFPADHRSWRHHKSDKSDATGLATSKCPKCPSGDVKAWYDTVSSRTDIRTPKNGVGKKEQKRQQIFFNKNYLADIALVVLVQPALLTVPILQHTPTHPDTRYKWYWILI